MSTEYISGGLETTGSAVVGGSLTVAGGTTLNGRVTVKGFLEAPNIKTPCKGLFASEKELQAQFPNPMSGWWALVGSSSPLSLYRASGGAWECIGTDTFTIEIENSSVVSAVEELQDKLATETSDRKAQDTTLQASIDTKQAALKHYAESSSALSGQTFISGSSSSSPETNGVYSVQAYGAAAHVADGTQVTRGRLVTFGFSIGLDLGEYTLSGYGKDMTMDATTADGSIHLQSPNGVITVAREIQMIAPKTTLTDGTEYNGAVRVYTNTTAQNEGFTHNGSKVLSVRDIEDDLLGEGREVSDGVSISAHSQALSAYQGLQLSNSISSEASTRASAVSSLQSSVSANASDISSLQSSVSSLESSVKSKQDWLSYYHEGTNTGQLGGMTASPDPVYLKWSYDSDTGQQIAIHTHNQDHDVLRANNTEGLVLSSGYETGVVSKITLNQGSLDIANYKTTLTCTGNVAVDTSAAGGTFTYNSSEVLTKGDVVNNLTSTSTDTPLSAYQGYLLNQNKQAKLTAGEGITISSANVISADISGYATSSELDAALDELEQSLSGSVQAEAEARQTADTSLRQSIDLKQDKLTAGEHITISSDNVISADLSDYATTDGLKAEAEAREQADAELTESVTETQESVEDTRTGFRALLTAMLGEGVTIEDGVVSGKIDQTSLAGIAVGAVNYETGLGFYFNEGEAYGGMYEAIEKLKAQLASVQEWIDDFELVTADDVASWFGGLRVEGSDGETDTAELVTRDDVAGWFGNSSSGSTGDSSSSSGVEIVTADDVKGWFNN